jgi:hypothetical protein
MEAPRFRVTIVLETAYGTTEEIKFSSSTMPDADNALFSILLPNRWAKLVGDGEDVDHETVVKGIMAGKFLEVVGKSTHAQWRTVTAGPYRGATIQTWHIEYR